jgi:PIN domain nuclease of toxin-antitoxin system
LKLLLDTCTFLWVAGQPDALSAQARTLFQDPENEVFLSAASAWEIAIKQTIGRLVLPEPADRLIPRLRKQHGVDALPIDEESTLHLSRLPPLHRDPFDRILVCQAIIHGMTLITPDDMIARYPARILW